MFTSNNAINTMVIVEKTSSGSTHMSGLRRDDSANGTAESGPPESGGAVINAGGGVTGRLLAGTRKNSVDISSRTPPMLTVNSSHHAPISLYQTFINSPICKKTKKK